MSLMPERVELPRGRSALPESEVAASRRGRILQAMLEEVASEGYRKATIASIIKRARVSRTSFYETFADKDEVFAEAHREITGQVIDLILAAIAEAPPGPLEDRLRAGVEAYVAAIESSPVFTVCFFVETHAASDAVLRQRDVLVDRVIEVLESGLAIEARSDPRVRVPPRGEMRAAVGAFDELVRRRLRHHRSGADLDLSGIVAPFVSLAMALLRVG